MAASCDSLKGCGWLSLVLLRRRGHEGVRHRVRVDRSARVRRFGFAACGLRSRAFASPTHISTFLRGFRAFPILLPLHLRQRRRPRRAGRDLVVPALFLNAAFTARQGRSAGVHPGMMRVGGDHAPFSPHRAGHNPSGRLPARPEGLVVFLAENGICRVSQPRAMAARKRAMHRIRPFKEGKA